VAKRRSAPKMKRKIRDRLPTNDVGKAEKIRRKFERELKGMLDETEEDS